jgi:hypothetical protein
MKVFQRSVAARGGASHKLRGGVIRRTLVKVMISHAQRPPMTHRASSRVLQTRTEIIRMVVADDVR